MTPSEIIILNFEEIRSIKLWNGLPPENYLSEQLLITIL